MEGTYAHCPRGFFLSWLMFRVAIRSLNFLRAFVSRSYSELAANSAHIYDRTDRTGRQK